MKAGLVRTHLIALSVLSCCASAQATSLSADGKVALAKGTLNSCLETQVKDAANKAMTVGQLQSYCDCYANAFADFMQVEDMEKNKETLTPETTKKAGEFSQKCAATSLKK